MMVIKIVYVISIFSLQLLYSFSICVGKQDLRPILGNHVVTRA